MLRQAQEPGLWTTGSDHGHPLVLVHGIRLSAHMWSAVAARLVPDFRISACDLPGHGALSERPFTLEGVVGQIEAAVAEATRATGHRPVVAGTSLGAISTLAYGAHGSDGAAGLFAHAATIRTDGPVTVPHRTAAVLQRLMGEECAFRLNRRVLQAKLPVDSFRGVMEGGLSRHVFGEAMAEMSRWDTLAMAGLVDAPLVLANGLDDPLFRLQERKFLERVQAVGTPVRLVHVPGPHLLPLTEPDTFSRVLRRAYEELSAMASRIADSGAVT
ncbi:alpha/beta hydrolase [Streptomyces sp. NBC_01474]|uniref:alpha/beta fold hydrolase n=1 Tax=Streptomyces TaxID=1883 RepID=UPI002DDA79AE|nr:MULTISPECIES: alpha/beta hydrolase [unclassified Streptomyces]WSE00136.1 alpha/beta hydrolase [Streptomyces sp. NBC_01474]